MVDFDLPAIQVWLQHLSCSSAEISGQQKGWIPVVLAGTSGCLIGQWGNNQQAQEPLACAALPVNAGHFLIADLPPLSAVEDPHFSPAYGVILTDLLWGELHCIIDSPAAGGGSA